MTNHSTIAVPAPAGYAVVILHVHHEHDGSKQAEVHATVPVIAFLVDSEGATQPVGPTGSIFTGRYRGLLLPDGCVVDYDDDDETWPDLKAFVQDHCLPPKTEEPV